MVKHARGALRCAVLLGLLLAAKICCGQKFYQCEPNEKPEVKVWAAESKEEADFWAFFVYDASELGAEGVVLQVPTKEEAQFTLSFVDNKEEADFSLWLVEDKSMAGWNHKEKAQILEKYVNKK